MRLASSRLANVSIEHLHEILSSDRPLLPELHLVRDHLGDLRRSRQAQQILEETWQFMTIDLTILPQSTCPDFEHIRSLRGGGSGSGSGGGGILEGTTPAWHHQYFLKRAQLNATALRWLLVEPENKPKMKRYVQDRLWAICEEPTWRAPSHSHTILDVLTAETGLALAELLYVFKACNISLDPEIRERVVFEIERRVLEAYVKHGRSQWWYNSSSDWNGIINGCVAATFVLLCNENPLRAAYGVQMALESLKVYFERAFEEDGVSTQGIALWERGLVYPLILSEFLFSKSDGELNLLGSERLGAIAVYPAKLLLSGSEFAPFAEGGSEKFIFSPGFLARLSVRAGDPALMNIIQTRTPASQGSYAASSFSRLIRDLLWWDGTTIDVSRVEDAVLLAAEITRLVTNLPGHNSQTVLIIKAGHNGEIHNRNDVASFVLHVDGENLLTDPGAAGKGISKRRGHSGDDEVFSNSFGRSVPRIGGQLQATGHMFHGELVRVEQFVDCKLVEVEFSQAYDTRDRLIGARRCIELPLSERDSPAHDSATIQLHDMFEFDEEAQEIEEAFVTWHECEIQGLAAIIHGCRYDLVMTVERPVGVGFTVIHLAEETRPGSDEVRVLKRIAAVMPRGELVMVDINIEVVERAR